MSTQREKDMQHASFRDNVTTGTLVAFADGAEHGRAGERKQVIAWLQTLDRVMLPAELIQSIERGEHVPK